MTDDTKAEAAQTASRAKGEAKAAARDAARAAKAGAEVAANEVKEEARDTVNKLEGTAQDAARAAKGIDVPGFLLDLSIGTGCTAISLFFATAAVHAFRNAPKNLKK